MKSHECFAHCERDKHLVAPVLDHLFVVRKWLRNGGNTLSVRETESHVVITHVKGIDGISGVLRC